MLRETESDKSADSLESSSIGHQQSADIEEPLQWHRASADSPIAQQLDQVLKIFGHAVSTYTKDLQKQVKPLKRF